MPCQTFSLDRLLEPSGTSVVFDYYNLENKDLNFSADLSIEEGFFESKTKIIDINTDGSQIIFTFGLNSSSITLLGFLDVKNRSIKLQNIKGWPAAKFPNSRKYVLFRDGTAFVVNAK